MYVIRSLTYDPAPEETDPIIMQRRTLIAAALGLPAAALPAWAAPAAATPDPDYTRLRGASWSEAYEKTWQELDALGSRYVTHAGALDRHTIMDSGLWLFAQASGLATKAELKHKRHARRLAAEAAMFTAGCYLDFGNNRAAVDLYSRAHNLCGDQDRDLRAFIDAQANWVPMYEGRWRTVLERSERVVAEAERFGGYGLLMGHCHRARALAVLGRRDEANEAAEAAQRAVARVPSCRTPQSALTYCETKVHFSVSTVFAEIGDVHRQNDAQHQALSDPTIGWIDRNLMQLGHSMLDKDPEYAARRIRMQVIQLPVDSFNHCVRAEAGRILGKLKASELARHRSTGSEVRALGRYLESIPMAA